MINFLKTYLSQGFLSGISVHDIDIVKTQNGLAHQDKKLVFYVFTKQYSQPALVIYASRQPQANSILEESIKSIELNQDCAPKILFKSYYQDILFVGLEYIIGQSLQLTKRSDLDLAFAWLQARYQTGQHNSIKSLAGFYEVLEKKFSAIGLSLDPTWRNKINQLANFNLPTIAQHGDWQDNNVFVSDKKLKIIDWDDYGFIDWPLFDFSTLYFKCWRKKVDANYLQGKKKEFFRAIALAEISDDVLRVFYELMNFLRKDKLHNKYERRQYYQALLKDLRK